MHDLLDQLRKHTPVHVTNVVDQGRSFHVAVRYGPASGSLTCRNWTPLASGDLTLAHGTETLSVPGTTPAELAGHVWCLLQLTRAARPPHRAMGTFQPPSPGLPSGPSEGQNGVGRTPIRHGSATRGSETMEIREDQQRRTLLEALHASFTGYGELWAAYRDLGGGAGEVEVDAYINGLLSLPSRERDLLSDAINELIDALPPLPRAARSDDPHPPSSAGTSTTRPE